MTNQCGVPTVLSAFICCAAFTAQAAVVETASTRGRNVAAHAIGTQGIANAVEAGVHSIEHGSGLTLAGDDDLLLAILDAGHQLR